MKRKYFEIVWDDDTVNITQDNIDIYLNKYSNKKEVTVNIHEVMFKNDSMGIGKNKQIIIPTEINMHDNGPLYDADPNCKHEIIGAPGGGIKCLKCKAWFCY